MNKGRRNELAGLKQKKRIKLYRFSADNIRAIGKLKNHATLCSCLMCSPYKYSRKVKHREVFENW